VRARTHPTGSKAVIRSGLPAGRSFLEWLRSGGPGHALPEAGRMGFGDGFSDRVTAAVAAVERVSDAEVVVVVAPAREAMLTSISWLQSGWACCRWA